MYKWIGVGGAGVCFRCSWKHGHRLTCHCLLYIKQQFPFNDVRFVKQLSSYFCDGSGLERFPGSCIVIHSLSLQVSFPITLKAQWLLALVGTAQYQLDILAIAGLGESL